MSGKGKGSITLLNNAKCNDVYWVEGLKYNLLSVAQLNNTGYRIEFQKGIVKVHDKHGKLAATGTQTKGNTFHLDSTQNKCLYEKIDDTWLWHKRFCHVNFDNLIKISKKHRVRGLPSLEKLENVMCRGCQMGKMTRSSFTSKSYTYKGILDLVHTDLCHPMKVQSYYGDKYFILFVDDYSRMTSVMFLKEKSEAFQMFKWYKARVENEIGRQLKCLRSDRGGGFTSDEFNLYCNDHGIKRQVSTPRTPQQNGIAKRRNRSIVDCARTLMIEKKVPQTFWREEISTTIYTLN